MVQSRLVTGSFIAFIPVLIIGILAAERLTPLTYAATSFYLIPLSLTRWIPFALSPLIVAGVCSSLAVLGSFPFLATGMASPEPVHRVATALALWMVALLLYHSKTRELSLLAREDKFRTILDYSPVLIWGAGTDGRRTLFNKHWLDFTGR